MTNLNDIYKAHDFYYVGTGGGCTAYQHDLENGHYILITDTDANAPETAEESCIVGLYGNDGYDLCYWDATDTAHALHIAKYAVSEWYADNEDAA